MKAHVSPSASFASSPAFFSSSDSSPRSAFSFDAATTATSSYLPTPCSAISSIWSRAKSTSYPCFFSRSRTGDADAAAFDAPEM